MAKSPDKPPMAPSYESDLRLEYTAAIIADRVKANKKLPMHVLFEVMDGHVEQKNMNAACAVALQLAPYVHPRLKDIVVTGNVQNDTSIRVESIKGIENLSDKELSVLEKILAKVSGEGGS